MKTRITKTRIMKVYSSLRITGGIHRLSDIRIEQEDDGQWYLIGYDLEDDQRTYAVVEASGPGVIAGLDLEEL